MDGDWPEVLNMRLIWFILISLVPFAYPASSAEPLSFDGIGPLGWVPGFDLLDLGRCEYCATETFDGVPSPQRFTGSGGLTEIYYAMPEHGQGLPTQWPPAILDTSTLRLHAGSGQSTVLDFEHVPPAIFSATATLTDGRVTTVCLNGSMSIRDIGPGRFDLNCPQGILRIRYSKIPGAIRSVSDWTSIEVPEPERNTMLVIGASLLAFASSRAERLARYSR